MGSHRSPQLSRTLRRGLSVLLPALLAAGCASKGFRDKGDWSSVGPDRRAVLSNAVAMLGQPYRYGGSAPGQGFDCSGLVQYTHGQAALPVPRTSAELYSRAKPKASDELTPGDLVFFRTRSTPSHVGIYLGRGQFVHAPYSGEAVRTENLLEGYWRERFIGAGHFYARDS
jgi:cell wall-associated NlpC family hydrolase